MASGILLYSVLRDSNLTPTSKIISAFLVISATTEDGKENFFKPKRTVGFFLNLGLKRQTVYDSIRNLKTNRFITFDDGLLTSTELLERSEKNKQYIPLIFDSNKRPSQIIAESIMSYACSNPYFNGVRSRRKLAKIFNIDRRIFNLIKKVRQTATNIMEDEDKVNEKINRAMSGLACL